MNEFPQTRNTVAKLPLLAAVVALLGLADAVYLTIHHYPNRKQASPKQMSTKKPTTRRL